MKIGIEKIRDNLQLAKEWGQCALLCNQASVDLHFKSSVDICSEVLGERLKCILGPQHGFYGTVQDNMIETDHEVHEFLKIPIYSLYSDVRQPTPEMLEGVDTLVFDLQITGCRIYTFKATLFNCLKAVKSLKKKLVVLDRPNPVGGQFLEGRVLDQSCFSFVGPSPVPMRHGLSVGEMARFFNQELKADLEVIWMDDWDPLKMCPQDQRPYVCTSPNLPTMDSVYVYPGTVMLEGTNLSEGRGTSLPFQLIGAPYLQNEFSFLKRIRDYLPETPGLFLRPCRFMPTFHKWSHETCYGIQIHVLNPLMVQSFNLTLAIMRVAIEIGGELFQWKKGPYEYEFDELPMKFIFGSNDIDEKLMSKHFSLHDDYWHGGIGSYIEQAEKILHYPRRLQTF